MTMSMNSNCSCNGGANCQGSSLTSCCNYSQGYSLLPGQANIITYVVPYSGTYTVSASVVNGTPPSNFEVFLNGVQAGTISGQGGTVQVNANPGDVITVYMTWGYSYWGASVQACVTAPPTPTPTPTPVPSQTPPSPTSSSGINTTTVLLFLIILVLAGLLLYEVILNKK